MPMYVKKPIPIEARQITADNAPELAEWSNSEVIKRPVDNTVSGLMVYTLEGAMTGQIGDYLIKGVRGEFYFCAKDIFEETYDEDVDIDPWHIEVLSFEDQPDGSAIVNFEMGKEAQKVFTEMGILKALTDAAKHVVSEVDEIDTNVGC